MKRAGTSAGFASRTGARAGFQRGGHGKQEVGTSWRPAGAVRGRKAVMDGELKFHDLDINQSPIAAAGDIAEDSLVTIAQGTDESTRIGRKVVIRSIGARCQLALPEFDAVADPVEGDVVRVILYLDKQCNGAAATVLGILESADYQSFNNLSNKGRFLTLFDKELPMSYQSLASDGAGVVSGGEVVDIFSFHKKCNIPIEYDNSVTTGAIGSVRTNNLGLLTISKTGTIKLFSKWRLRFTDN